MWQLIRSFTVALALVAVFLLNSYQAPAIAVLRSLEEAPGQMLYQSRHSLRDNLGNTWQVILFKRVKPDDSTTVSLRLVDFPGRAVFQHPQPLTIIGEQQKRWQAPDLFAEKSPAANVGQFDVQDILAEVSQTQQLELLLPLKQEQPVSLKIPNAVTLEWQTML